MGKTGIVLLNKLKILNKWLQYLLYKVVLNLWCAFAASQVYD